MDRRTFLFGAAVVVTGLALAERLSRPRSSSRVALRIAGWDAPGDDPAAEVWIALGRSFRTAWR